MCYQINQINKRLYKRCLCKLKISKHKYLNTGDVFILRALKVNSLQYIPRNMHTIFVLLCFVVVIHWLISPYPSGLLHWHCGNLTIAPVPAKQIWWIWINTSCEFIMNDCITTTKQSTTKPCAYFLGYTVCTKLGWQIRKDWESCLRIWQRWKPYLTDIWRLDNKFPLD